MTVQRQATMQAIYHWRDELRIAEQRLEAAYIHDLPPGTLVAYTHGQTEVIVEVVEHISRLRCKVRNLASDREYQIEYARFDRVVEA